MVDDTLVFRKLAALEEYLLQIMEFKDINVKQYQTDWKLQRIVERTLQMMIETSADIASHVISDRKYRIPNSYAETFEILYENNLISKALCEMLKKMSGFRNIIVHNYDRIDAEIVVGILKKNLDDFICYKNAIVKLLHR